MRLSFGLEHRQLQVQKLAPRMIQSMEILQLPLQELQERIEQELVENPALEHFGANLGPAEVEIYAASIFETGLPPAITMP